MQDIATTVMELIETRYELRLHREREDIQRLLFNQVPTASAHCALDGQIRTANRRFTTALGYDDEALDGKRGATIVHPDEIGALWELHRSLLVGDRAEVIRPTTMVKADGTVQVMNVRWVIIRNAAGAASFSLVTLFPRNRFAWKGRTASRRIVTSGRKRISASCTIRALRR